MKDRPACKACGITVRLREEDIARLTNKYVRDHAAHEADPDIARERMERCRECPELMYGTTCRHCGCLAAVLTRIAKKHCPHPDGARWE